MSFEQAIQELAARLQSVAPGFALVFIRISAMMVFAPLFGSAKIPKRVKMLLAIILSQVAKSAEPLSHASICVTKVQLVRFESQTLAHPFLKVCPSGGTNKTRSNQDRLRAAEKKRKI